ncbi:hypothetical protein NE237_000752 [Protea cynaroides]|uniref:Uncharacterized protein n=1 Tax=Protea cynaroides TaxID=273540 RepID=A0A9Q0KSQ4_9MAGN|nr:hypothetical protein NE237_000752 [Protea cynaroides]
MGGEVVVVDVGREGAILGPGGAVQGGRGNGLDLEIGGIGRGILPGLQVEKEDEKKPRRLLGLRLGVGGGKERNRREEAHWVFAWSEIHRRVGKLARFEMGK